MKEHYCHNCGHWSELTDGVYCTWCLAFWQTANRMPGYGETMPVS